MHAKAPDRGLFFFACWPDVSRMGHINIQGSIADALHACRPVAVRGSAGLCIHIPTLGAGRHALHRVHSQRWIVRLSGNGTYCWHFGRVARGAKVPNAATDDAEIVVEVGESSQHRDSMAINYNLR